MVKDNADKPVRTGAYTVRRCDPELVAPASRTPRETKRLSDLDDIGRLHVSLAFFYRGHGEEGDAGMHPAGVIRRALGEALVHYYPLAGRVREMEMEGRKLVVDCTGEGVLFVQAEADVELADLEAAGLRPPFACWDQLLFQVEGSSGVLNSPLLLIQVTRLRCGGFVLALRFNHTICDGMGIAQFVNAVGELARGLPYMKVTPVWSRELIQAPRPSLLYAGAAAHDDVRPPSPPPASDMVMRSFSFRPSDVVAIKKRLPLILQDTATTFDALAAFVSRARAIALEVPPAEVATLGILVNLRGTAQMSLPEGYYGNAVMVSTVRVDAATLRCGDSLGDTVALVQMAKAVVTSQHLPWMLDELVMLGARWFLQPNTFVLSDVRKLGFDRADFGWGGPVFAGPAEAVFGTGVFIAVKNGDGEDLVVVPLMLPRLAMDRFAAEVDKLSNVV